MKARSKSQKDGGRLDYSYGDIAFNAISEGNVELFRYAMRSVDRGATFPINHFQHIVMLGKPGVRRKFIDAALGDLALGPDDLNVHGTSAMDFAVSYMTDDLEYFGKMLGSSMKPLRTLELARKDIKETKARLAKETIPIAKTMLEARLAAQIMMEEMAKKQYRANPGLYSVTERSAVAGSSRTFSVAGNNSVAGLARTDSKPQTQAKSKF